MTDARRNYETTRDEFIQDYLDRHGHNQATRTEAEDLADEWRDVARDAVQFARLAVKRAESVSNPFRDIDILGVSFDVAAAIYDFDDDWRDEVISAAIKLAMSEGES